MLTDRTVKLITEFGGWEYPNLHQHKFVINHPFSKDGSIKTTTYERWVDRGYRGYYPNISLNESEQKELEKLLIEQPTEQNYEVVETFINWVLKNVEVFDDCKQPIFDGMEYDYYLMGRSHSSFDDTPLDHNWFQTDHRWVNFWDRHYRMEYVERTLPHYVEILRRLIKGRSFFRFYDTTKVGH